MLRFLRSIRVTKLCIASHILVLPMQRQAPFTQAAQAKPVSRVALRVEANKKVVKKQKVRNLA